ncbi:MAG: hypothetical protein QGF00_31060 [Planctomycetota bacterium]|jgi:hypothetical protein|nr:hypothetical protein [Planctomycetota bacterium]
MKVTSEQLQALKNGKTVSIEVDRTECILVRKDVYQKIRQLSYDDSEWTEDEMEALAGEMFDQLDNPQKIQ